MGRRAHQGLRGANYSLRTEELPPPLREALLSSRTDHRSTISARPGSGLSDGAKSGLYASLRARGSLVGLIAVEAQRPSHFTVQHSETRQRRHRDVRRGDRQRPAVPPAALGRRRRGAQPDRPRAARPDRQLARPARVRGRPARRAWPSGATNVHESLVDLRGQVTSVVERGPRDALRPAHRRVRGPGSGRHADDVLRAGSPAHRARRSSSTIAADRRLPILQERELWQIAREAITNAERHAQASSLTLSGAAPARSAELDDHGQWPRFHKGHRSARLVRICSECVNVRQA